MTDSLRFEGLRSVRKRREPLRAIVLHWTGGIGDPAQVYRTLRSRVTPNAPEGLSIHYVVGSDGLVVQMASENLVCLHAGLANEWSIGIEVVCPGFPGTLQAKEAARGVHRDLYRDSLRGRWVRMLDYTARQQEAVVVLVEALCDAFSIPKRVPCEKDGSLARRKLTSPELANFSGVLGHYHAHDQKMDPGTRPLERLRVRWSRDDA